MSKRRWWFCLTVSILGAAIATFQWIRHALGYSTLFTLRQLFSVVAVAAAIVAIGTWQPFLGLGLSLYASATVAVLFSRTPLRTSFWVSLLFSLFWLESYKVSVSAHWGFENVTHQMTSQRGRIFFFRFLGGGDGFRPFIELSPDPRTNHWRKWPGFHHSQYPLRLPGIEFARSQFIVPIGQKKAVDGVEILTLSYPAVVAMLMTTLTFVVCVRTKIGVAEQVRL